jgi:hypothetical protein
MKEKRDERAEVGRESDTPETERDAEREQSVDNLSSFCLLPFQMRSKLEAASAPESETSSADIAAMMQHLRTKFRRALTRLRNQPASPAAQQQTGEGGSSASGSATKEKK